MEALRPAHSVTTPEAGTVLLPVERARQVVGIYDADEYTDSTVANLVNTAAHYLARLADRPITNSACVDRYARWARRFQIRAHQGAVSMLALKYYDASDTLQTIPSAQYLVDETGRDKAVVVRESVTEGLMLSDRRENPIEISYHLNPLAGGGGPPSAEAISLIFKGLFDQSARADGGEGIPDATIRAARGLIQPWLGPGI